jgi:glycosyltransferase involved in cell wall biosynthesis
MSRILFINHTRELHGSEQVLLQSLRIAHEAGHRVSLLMPAQVSDCGFDEVAKPYTDHILLLPYRPAGRHIIRTLAVLLYNLPALFRAARYIKKEKIDCICSNTSVTILGIYLAKLTGLPHIWHFHEPVSPMFGWHVSLRSLYRRALSYSRNYVIFISKRQQAEWESTLGMTVTGTVIYNPIRRLDITRQPHEGVVVGYMGNFEERKNLSCLVVAFELVHSIHPETRLLLCGAKNRRDIADIQSLTSLQPPAIDIRTFTRAEDFYALCDIFVLPSFSETMPLVSIEAAQAGVCVIQTCRSGLSELYQHEENTLFFTPENTEQLAVLIEKCLDDDYRQRIAANGQARTQALDFNSQYKQRLLSVFCNMTHNE